MSVLPLIAARKSEGTITVVDGSSLTYYPITDWDIRVIIILWVLFFLTSIFCVLRLYSRIKILQFYALEDYLYNFAFVSYIYFSVSLATLHMSSRVMGQFPSLGTVSLFFPFFPLRFGFLSNLDMVMDGFTM